MGICVLHTTSMAGNCTKLNKYRTLVHKHTTIYKLTWKLKLSKCTHNANPYFLGGHTVLFMNIVCTKSTYQCTCLQFSHCHMSHVFFHNKCFKEDTELQIYKTQKI